MLSESAGIALIVVTGIGGLLFAAFQMYLVSCVDINSKIPEHHRKLSRGGEGKTDEDFSRVPLSSRAADSAGGERPVLARSHTQQLRPNGRRRSRPVGTLP